VVALTQTGIPGHHRVSMESGPKPRRTRRRARRSALIVLIFGLALAALFAAGLFPQEFLRYALERQLQRRLGPACRVGRLRVVPALLEVRAADVQIETAALSASLPSARLDLGLASLLGGELAFQAVELREPKLKLRVGGRSTSKPSALTGSIAVAHLLITGGEITIEDPAHTLAHVTGIEARGSLGQGVLEIRAGTGIVFDAPLLG
jgi:hypothetical protein